MAAISSLVGSTGNHLLHNAGNYLALSPAVLFAALNVKNLPGFWHVRVLRAIEYHLHRQPEAPQPQDLFKPVITSSSATLWERDWNGHKSNSTYFTDLDVSRAHAMTCLTHVGFAKFESGDTSLLPPRIAKAPGVCKLALGGVSCLFHREMQPLQQYEIHTRLLCWDSKWLYCVSYVLDKDAVKPSEYVLQPWKEGASESESATEEVAVSQHLYTSSIARYAFTKGRFTLNPEILLEAAGLLPPRPKGVSLPPRAPAQSTKFRRTISSDDYWAPMADNSDGSDDDDYVIDELEAQNKRWSWDDMEQERLHGLKLAKHFSSLGDLPDELRTGGALGQFGDYFFT